MLMNVIVRGSLYPDVAILIDDVMWRASSWAKERDIKMTLTFYAVISHHRAEMMMDELVICTGGSAQLLGDHVIP
jgi:hypothetical protein